MVCKDVVTKPVLQDVDGEQLTRGWNNRAQRARLDVHACVFWEHQWSAVFDVRVSPRKLNAIGSSSRSKYIVCARMRKSVNTQARGPGYSSRVLGIEHGTLNPLIFTTTGGIERSVWTTTVDDTQQTSRADCYQERRVLRQNNLMDTSKNLLYTSEIRINLSQRN